MQCGIRESLQHVHHHHVYGLKRASQRLQVHMQTDSDLAVVWWQAAAAAAAAARHHEAGSDMCVRSTVSREGVSQHNVISAS